MTYLKTVFLATLSLFCTSLIAADNADLVIGVIGDRVYLNPINLYFTRDKIIMHTEQGPFALSTISYDEDGVYINKKGIYLTDQECKWRLLPRPAWICPECDNWNPPRADRCQLCDYDPDEERPEDNDEEASDNSYYETSVTKMGAPVSTWICPHCQTENPSDRERCKRCNKTHWEDP